MLRRGSLLQGASRYRWEGFETSVPELEPLLEQLDRSLPFNRVQSAPVLALHPGPGSGKRLTCLLKIIIYLTQAFDPWQRKTSGFQQVVGDPPLGILVGILIEI